MSWRVADPCAGTLVPAPPCKMTPEAALKVAVSLAELNAVMNQLRLVGSDGERTGVRTYHAYVRTVRYQPVKEHRQNYNDVKTSLMDTDDETSRVRFFVGLFSAIHGTSADNVPVQVRLGVYATKTSTGGAVTQVLQPPTKAPIFLMTLVLALMSYVMQRPNDVYYVDGTDIGLLGREYDVRDFLSRLLKTSHSTAISAEHLCQRWCALSKELRRS